MVGAQPAIERGIGVSFPLGQGPEGYNWVRRANMIALERILLYIRIHSQVSAEAAVRRAAQLAKAAGGVVKVVDVEEDLPVYSRMPTHGLPALSDLLLEEKKNGLAKIAGRLKSEGVEAEVAVLDGKDALALIEEVVAGGHSALVTTADGGRQSAVNHRLLRKCPCPVWIVRPDAGEREKRVVAAVDPTPSAPEGEALNRAILDAASSAARLDGAELHVLHVFDPLNDMPLDAEGGATDDRWADYRKAARAEAERGLRDLAAGVDGVTEAHLIDGDPGDMITKFCEETEAGLLVMGTVARTGVTGLLIGNTAERVLGKVECSVLALKPEGFRAPMGGDEG